MKKNRLKKQGFTLVEAMMGMTITGIVLVGVISSQMGNYKAVEKNKDVIFAQNKATQMIEELRSVVRKGRSNVNSLDIYDDKNAPNPILTTDDIEGSTTEAKATNQISGNKIQNGKWRFVRDVKISKNSDLAKSRTVIVSVYYADANGNPVQPPLATLSTILSTAHTSNIPTQVIDTYALAINNQPGWWSSLSSLKQTIQDSAYDLKVKNPGLDYRFHFITRSSFGRDPYYSPYCNKTATTASDTNIAYPYVYNGKISDTAHGGNTTYFYNPVEMINDGMRLKTDNTGTTFYNTWYGTKDLPVSTLLDTNNDNELALTNVYSAADQYNHAVRGPEDVAINEKLKNYYSAQDPVVEYEPSYRKFIDDMYESDSLNKNPIHRNLLITNLHGELFPTIPLRNYADAAKTPDGQEVTHNISSTGIINVKDPTNTSKDLLISNKYKRVVTHPEQLEYSTDATKDRKIYLRVYPYLSDPTKTTANVNKIDTISLFIPTTNYVGAQTNGTKTQTLANLPDFKIPDSGTSLSNVITQIKNNIKFQYIDDDFVKRSNNYSAYVKITKPKKNAPPPNSTNIYDILKNYRVTFNPIGSTFFINDGNKSYKFKVVARRTNTGKDDYTPTNFVLPDSDSIIDTNNPDANEDNIYKIVSCDLDKEETLTVPTDLNNYFKNNQVLSTWDTTNFPSTPTTNNGLINKQDGNVWNVQIESLYKKTSSKFDYIYYKNANDPNISTKNNAQLDTNPNTSLGLDATSPEKDPKIHTVYDGTYEVIVNPAFDRMGTGTKTINPGILIKLHGTGTKHIGRYTGSTYIGDGGIPEASRLYGLDYIPSPLGKNMYDPNGNQSYPIKDMNVNNYYTNSFTDTNLGGSNNSDLLFGSGYGAYTGLKGRDLDNSGSYAKNTARWIISINVGKSGNTTNILSGFQDKMMAVETRIGENLNTGMSINQTPNPYDGTVTQKAFLSSNTNGYVVVNDISSETATNGTYPCNSNVSDCVTGSAIASNTTNPTVSDLNKKDLSNLSRTYVWIGDSAQNGIKESERYQMVGDIRHNPYIDTLEYNRVNLHFNTIVDKGSDKDIDTAGSLRNSTSDTSSVDYPNLGDFNANTTLAQNKTVLDISRFFELFKKAITNTNSIYNSLIGYSFYYYGLGGEVGSNGNALNNATITGAKGSVNFIASKIPYNDTLDGQIGEGDGDRYNEILEAGTRPLATTVGSRIIGNNDQSWGSLPWIGELYPDDFFGGTQAVSWSNTGNLPSAISDSGTNTSSSKFSRQLYTKEFKNISSDWATKKAYSITNIEPRNRLTDTGAKIFFHGSDDPGSKSKSFSQYLAAPPIEPSMPTGDITNTGKDLVANYGLIMPSTIDVARPFNFIGDAPDTPLWKMYNSNFSQLYFLNNTTYDTATTSGSTAVFYDSGAGGSTHDDKKYAEMAASAPVVIDSSNWKTSGRTRGYVLINGLASQGIESGTIIGRYALMSMLHTYFRTGNKNSSSDINVLNNRSIMLERTVIQDTTNAKSPAVLTPRDGVEIKLSDSNYGSGIPITWQTSWKKWDGTDYTKDYVTTTDWEEQNVSVKYNVLVSNDNRKTWKYLKLDGALSTELATLGVYNSSHVLNTVLSSSGKAVSDTAKLKLDGLDGEVIFRVEGHRFDVSPEAKLSDPTNGLLIPTNYSYHERTVSINRS